MKTFNIVFDKILIFFFFTCFKNFFLKKSHFQDLGEENQNFSHIFFTT